MVVWKECKTKEFQKKLQQLPWNEKEEEDDHVRDGGTRLRIS
jgi:hypothetical protein